MCRLFGSGFGSSGCQLFWVSGYIVEIHLFDLAWPSKKMKLACFPVWCTNNPAQMPHIQSAPCTSAVGHWFSQMMIVSAGRTKEASLGGGTVCPALLSAAFQVTEQLFMA